MSAWRIKMRERLVRNTEEPENEQACWLWKRKKDREHYGQLNVWVPGLGKTFTMKSHILLWLLTMTEPEDIETADDAYLAYKELTLSGLHLDHSCCARACANPDHLKPETALDNMRLRDHRRKTLPMLWGAR